MESIHARIKRLREAKGLTQQQLAQLAKVAFQSVQQWEREKGGTAPARKRQEAVAAALGVSVQELMTGLPQPLETRQNPPRYEAGPRAAKLAAEFYWLTDDQKVELLRQVSVMAETNKAFLKQMSGKLSPIPDKAVEKHLPSAKHKPIKK